MIESLALCLVVTAVFALTGLYCAGRLVRRQSAVGAGTYVAHLLMSVAMIVMAWPAGMAVPVIPQVVLFSVAAVWFVLIALAYGRSWVRDSHAEHHGRIVYWYHAGMMAAMVWMLVAMGTTMGSRASMGSARTMSGMPGMVMSARPSVATAVVAWGLGLAFCLAALAWLGSLIPEPSRREEGRGVAVMTRTVPVTAILLETGYEVLMAGGMAIMCFAFL